MGSATEKRPVTATRHFTSPVVELIFEKDGVLKKGQDTLDTVGTIVGHVKTYAGKNAFRVYNVLSESIGTNSIGTMQGMVKSARWKTAFKIAAETGEKIEFIALLASFASNVAEARPEFEAICNSRDSEALKAVHLAELSRAVAYRTAIGVVTGGVHMMYQALTGWCMIGGALTQGVQNAGSNQCVKILSDADMYVEKAGKWMADTAAKSDPTLRLIEIRLSKQ